MDLPIKNPPTPTTHIPTLPPPSKRRSRQRRLCLCGCLCCLSVVLVVFLVLLILALTLYKPKDPTLALDSITLTGVAPSVSLPTFQLSINVTLHLKISVHNPNRVSFSHSNGSTDIDYRGARVGTAVVAEGNIPSRGSSVLDVDVELRSGNFTAKLQDLVNDLGAGRMEFETSSRIPGKVKILGFIRKHAVAYSDCRLVVALPALTVPDQECNHKTKL